MSFALDLIELSQKLKQEKLFIDCERQQLQQLNNEVGKTSESLYCLSWITRQQKANLNDLIFASHDATPVSCCKKANSLESVTFVDAYKVLTYHESKIGDTLKLLRSQDVPLFVVSNKKGDNLRAELEHLDWNHYFLNAVGAGDAAATFPCIIAAAGSQTDQ